MGTAGLLLAALLVSDACAAENPAATIRKLTGFRTKIVWIRAPGGQGHPFGPPPNSPPIWKIIVLDTDENGGKERELQSEPGTYSHCMITPTGTRVIWTDPTAQVWVIDWDGKNKKKLLDGALAVGVAENPPGTEWVYTQEGPKGPGNGADVYRHQIDDPSKKELVWNKTPSNDKWEFTRDGKYGASGLPWPHAGVAELPNGAFKIFGDGCTPGIAGDRSAVMHMIAAGHRGIVVYNPDGSNPRQILFAQAPGVAGTPDPQFWWASFARYDGRFFTFSGPHPSMRPARGDIYFCMFTPRRDGVAKWVQVCNTPDLDAQGYAWIDKPGPRQVKKPTPQTPAPTAPTGPATPANAGTSPTPRTPAPATPTRPVPPADAKTSPTPPATRP